MLSDVAKKLHQISVKLFDKCEKRNKIQQTNVKKSRHCCHIYDAVPWACTFLHHVAAKCALVREYPYPATIKILVCQFINSGSQDI
eukprot:TRINITY_DN4393_c0_g1_i2.p1 TRINITY_DN4393_c0_g1~~TRINITY_DN4393_c0_g1_i2.p1  ORF type:complete len:86 (+),score=8.12 TRINITY_DN4393_c0_g1_i2:128-385(+)